LPFPALAPDTDCNTVCTGDNTELCGAGNRLAVYVDTSVPDDGMFWSCLTCYELHRGTTNGTLTFNLTAQPLASAAFPIETPTSLAPFQLAAIELAATMGQPTLQNLTAFTGSDSLLTTFSIPCDDGRAYGFALQTVGGPQQTVPGPMQAFTIPTSFGQALQLAEADGPSTISQNFCAQPNIFSKSAFIGPPLLGNDGSFNDWGFCPLHTFPGGSTYVVTLAANLASVLCIPILLELSLISS
jgi:hypothetical protein